jgi:DNA-binding response OmpR family regulator
MKTVLVADDDPAIRELIVWKLEHAGYGAIATADGKAALAVTIAARPDLVILDWTMPELTGVEVCRAIRENPLSTAIPVILLTARFDETEVETGFAAGADDYIRKPFSPVEMLDRVEAVLARRQDGMGVAGRR